MKSGGRVGSTRIIGGRAAREAELPWQVSLFENNYNAGCGGTLVSSSKVISAAHCFHNVPDPQQWTIKAGHVRISEKGENIQIKQVTKIYDHPLVLISLLRLLK